MRPLHLCGSQGTASTLTRTEVRGGGKKPYAQKGTGNARRGSSTSPLFPGGGVSFGPKVRGRALHACMHAGMEQLKWGGAAGSGAHGRISAAAGSSLPSHAHTQAMPLS